MKIYVGFNSYLSSIVDASIEDESFSYSVDNNTVTNNKNKKIKTITTITRHVYQLGKYGKRPLRGSFVRSNYY
jgi:hypothetical protein